MVKVGSQLCPRRTSRWPKTPVGWLATCLLGLPVALLFLIALASLTAGASYLGYLGSRATVFDTWGALHIVSTVLANAAVMAALLDPGDTILGLDAGANDYVTKPFKFPVLLARIRAQLRQHEQSEDAVFTVGPYTFKPSMKMLVTEDEKKIRLTEKETNILKFLYRSTEGVVPRDTLLHEVWGYNAGVTTHTLETHIYRLRQKIEPDPSNARLLVTESGGYRLVS